MQDHDEFYRTLCSSETLRSGRKGFFHDFSELVMQTAGDTWTSGTFGRIDDDEGRVRAIFADAKVRDVVADTLAKVKPLFRDKDAEISRRRRLEGYQLAAVGEHDKALCCSVKLSCVRLSQVETRRSIRVCRCPWRCWEEPRSLWPSKSIISRWRICDWPPSTNCRINRRMAATAAAAAAAAATERN
ncbi:uncharacterized protein LOC105431063 [Pogonomyrmex barbatus]|uniref:Uncharacterized protein LOC105431063 n=1 Tax=Pogonomyrmex barbatus TaxID=144034 RepID=A0A6I9WJM1_9HYME|nr:uncharacterized protein LOC105431063 [Pogonomyrmex barbatus]